MPTRQKEQWLGRVVNAFSDCRASCHKLPSEKCDDTNGTMAALVDHGLASDSDEAINDPPWSKQEPQQRRRLSKALKVQATLSFAVACLLLLILARLFWQPKVSQGKEGVEVEKLYHCGNSSNEARSRGCEFDMLSYSWTPRICYERTSAQEFRNWLSHEDRRFGVFPFFFDQEGTARVTDELELSESYGRTIYTTQEEHLGHCTFLMRRWHRIAKQREYSHHINHRFGKYIHTEHCTKRILSVLTDPSVLSEERLNSRFGITFEKC